MKLGPCLFYFVYFRNCYGHPQTKYTFFYYLLRRIFIWHPSRDILSPFHGFQITPLPSSTLTDSRKYSPFRLLSTERPHFSCHQTPLSAPAQFFFLELSLSLSKVEKAHCCLTRPSPWKNKKKLTKTERRNVICETWPLGDCFLKVRFV